MVGFVRNIINLIIIFCDKWSSTTTSSPTSIWESTGKPTSEFGSTKLPERAEDFRQEELELPPLPLDLWICWDPLLDAPPSGITIESETEEASPSRKSKPPVWASNSLDPSESQLITDVKTDLRSLWTPTSRDCCSMWTTWFCSPETRNPPWPRPSQASLTIPLRRTRPWTPRPWSTPCPPWSREWSPSELLFWNLPESRMCTEPSDKSGTTKETRARDKRRLEKPKRRNDHES